MSNSRVTSIQRQPAATGVTPIGTSYAAGAPEIVLFVWARLFGASPTSPRTIDVWVENDLGPVFGPFPVSTPPVGGAGPGDVAEESFRVTGLVSGADYRICVGASGLPFFLPGDEVGVVVVDAEQPGFGVTRVAAPGGASAVSGTTSPVVVASTSSAMPSAMTAAPTSSTKRARK